MDIKLISKLFFLTCMVISCVVNAGPLYEAVKDGNSESVRQLLHNGADPNDILDDPMADYDNFSSLCLAAYWGNTEIIELLCKAGAPVNYVIRDNRDFDGETPLTLAVGKNRIAAVEMLINYGAHVNKSVDPGRELINPVMEELRDLTPLSIAAILGYTEIIELLCKAGAEVNYVVPDNPNYKDATPLVMAVINNQVAAVEMLIKYRAYVNINRPINPSIEDFNNFTPLCLAAYFGHVEIIDLLCKAGAQVDYVITNNPVGWNGSTPLCVAIEKNQIAAAQMLINHGANVNRSIDAPDTDDHNLTPLCIAVLYGQREIIETLCKAGANVDYIVNDNPQGWEGYDCIRLAMDKGDLQTVKKLVEAGASTVGAQNFDENDFDPDVTPEVRQQIHGYIAKAPALQSLLRKLRDIHNLDEIIHEHKQKIARLTQIFNEYTAIDFKQAEHTKARIANLVNEAQECTARIRVLAPEITELVQQGVDLNCQDLQGNTPLHYLNGFGDPQVPTYLDMLARLVINRGANPNIVNDKGDTPLSCAARCGNSRMIKYLLTHGAEPEMGNNLFLAALEGGQWVNINRRLFWT